MSKEFLKLIKFNLFLFLSLFLIGLISTFYFYIHTPVTYSSKGYFRYIEPGGVTKTTKIDNNGTITYESFKPGNDGLHISSLIKSDTLKLSYNSGNNLYTLNSLTTKSNFSIKEVNEFLEYLLDQNVYFLNEKIRDSNSLSEKNKFEMLLRNEKKSFPLIIKADKFEIIDKRYLIIFFGVILSFFISLTLILLKKRVDEI